MMNTIITTVGITVIAIILLELIGCFINRYYFSSKTRLTNLKGTVSDPLFETADSYDNTGWYPACFREASEIFKKFRWGSLGLWHSPRFNGQYITIEKNNLRRTVHANQCARYEGSPKVFFFGGSTTWGWGARDEHTIPSCFSKLLPKAYIENHGELGFVTSQELVLFVQTIKSNHVPDYIIFLDGVNDMFSAYLAGAAGVELGALKKKAAFEDNVESKLLPILKQKSAICTLVKNFKQQNLPSNANKDYYDLAQDIVSVYNQNIKFITRVCQEYGIKPIFIWQPTLFDKPNLTAYETTLLDTIKEWQPLYDAVKTIIASEDSLAPSVLNFSDCFATETKPIYVDPWHYNEDANDYIARLLVAKKFQSINISHEDHLRTECSHAATAC